MKQIFALLLISLVFFSPFFVNPERLTKRGNDLSEEFIPLFAYFKRSLWEFGEIPFWQNSVLSGSPLLGDPQNPWAYPLYWLYILLPRDLVSIFLFTFHFFLAGFFTYWLIRSLGLSKQASFIGGLVYMLAPKLTAHLEAGHLGMVIAFSFAPLFFLATKKMLAEPKLVWPLLFGLSGGWMLVTYFTVFYYALIGVICIAGWYMLNRGVKRMKWRRILIALLVMVGISLPQLLAGSEFLSLSNRDNLTFTDIAQPLWSWKKIFVALVYPFAQSYNSLQTEEVLFPGFLPSVLALIGFLTLNRRYKIVAFFVFISVLLISINTKTPIYKLLYTYLPGMRYLRITTRGWFIVSLLFSVLAGYGIDNLGRVVQSFKRLNYFVLATTVLAVIELSLLGYWRLAKPVEPSRQLPESFTNFFNQESEYYRVYCTTGCVPLGKFTPSGKGNVGGYNPVHLAIYDEYLRRAGGYTFSGFSPILPPYQIYDEKPQPSAKLLGLLATRYVLSPYPLKDSSFKEIAKKGEYILYRNLGEVPHVSWQKQGQTVPLQFRWGSNGGIISTKGLINVEVVVSEIYYPAWKAKNEQGEYLTVKKKNDIIFSVPISVPTSSITIFYQPEGIPWSLTICLGTYFGIVIYVGFKLTSHIIPFITSMIRIIRVRG